MNKKCVAVLIGALVLAFEGMVLGDDDLTVMIEQDTVFTGNVTIPDDQIWEILPGVSIYFEGYYRLSIRGVLIAEGTRDEQIVFSCPGRQRGADTKPCWQGIEIVGKKANAVMAHCRIEGAYRNIVWESSPVFDSCEIVGNHYALFCSKHSTVNIKNSRIYGNTYGVVSEYSSPLMLNNVITDNTVGVNLIFSSRMIAGKNRIEGNITNIRTENALGENRDATSAEYLWKLMQQLY